jgi:hypothetical protein
MKVIVYLIISTLASLTTEGQIDSIYAEIKITSIAFEGKKLKLDSTKILKLEKYGVTEIMSLGIINGKELGLQFEIIKSHLSNKIVMVNGKAYFIKRGGEWKISSVINYQESRFKVISDKTKIRREDFEMGGTTVSSVKSTSELTINYLDRYYIFN